MSQEERKRRGTAVNEIETKHKGIMNVIDNLIKLCEDATNEEQCRRVEEEVRRFGGSVLDMFKTEEKYMIEHGYPNYDPHKAEHMEFLLNYSSLKRLLEDEGDMSVIMKATKNQAIEWLVNHMTHADKELITFLKKGED